MYTWAGEPEAEAVAARAAELVAAELRAALPAASYRAILLVGGYGRGEGGVLRTSAGVRLHNNLDILIIAAGPWLAVRARLHARATAALAPIAARIGVGIDVGVIGEWTLRHAPCRVFYYDLRHGHRTLVGDPAYAPGLPFTAEAIIGEDVLALVANRGTLLAINQALIAAGGASRAVVTKHTAKAILGYGDGWLWLHGRYHWSYAERRSRMQATDAPNWLAELYERAARQRFSPHEDAFAGLDLVADNDALLARLEPVHRALVAHVDGRFVSWADHASARGLRARVARALGRRPALHRLFPLIAYAGLPAARALAGRVLGVAPHPDPLRAAYLRAWGADGDPNFEAAATAMGLALEGA